MTDEARDPTAPLTVQPTSTTVPGLAIETGHYQPMPPLSPEVALELEDRRAFRNAIPAYDDLESLRRTCHQAADGPILKRYYAGEEISDGQPWQGVRVEIIAFPLVAGESRVPLGHPWVYHEFPRIDGPCIIARWLHRYPGHDGILEVTWDGQRFFATRIRRSVHFYGPGTTEDAARLLALWVTDDAGVSQRPHRRRLIEDLESGWVELTKKAITYKQARGGRTWAEAARQVGISVRQLNTWRSELTKLPNPAESGS